MARRTTKAAKPAPVEEPEELLEDDTEEEIDDLEVDDVEEADDPEELGEDEEEDEEDEEEELPDDEEEDEVEEFDELEVDESEEEIEEDDEPAPTTKKTAKKKATSQKSPPKSTAPEFGTKELVAHVNSQTGKNLDGRAVRLVLRKLAREGVLQRTVGEERGRYSFTGPNDPQVKAVVTAIKSGASDKTPAPKKPVSKAKAEPAKKTVKKTASGTKRAKPAAPPATRKTTTRRRKPSAE